MAALLKALARVAGLEPASEGVWSQRFDLNKYLLEIFSFL